jgi:3-dehydroquinate synthase
VKALALLSPPVLAFVLVYIGALVVLFVSAFWQVNSFTGQIEHIWNLGNFSSLIHDAVYRRIAGRTIGLAAATTATDALLAFGGGVVCDLVGFSAACYLRGVGLVNAPTTLLAQVDASVGGKTGINHPRGKNLIGAFYQPLCVVADTDMLATLSPRSFAAGMAEVAKMAMILDADLFGRLETVAPSLQPGDAQALGPIVARSIELKAQVVERDERESGERMLLNYGHTVGHALEAVAGYGKLLHGEAVAVGMQAAALIAQRLGVLDSTDADRQAHLLQALRLPLDWPAPAEDVLARLALDKKRAGARQRWVIAERVGNGRVRDDVPAELAREAVETVTRT